MRTTTTLLFLLLLSGCVTGPVQKGPVTTRDLQDMGEDEGRKLAELATRNTIARYDGLMARTWRTWKRGEARLLAKRPPDGVTLTPAQAQTFAKTVAEELVAAAEVRDNKLATHDRKRAAELEQINKLHANQIAALAGVVKGWAAQGEITTGAFRAWLDVAQQGAAFYVEQQHIKRLRREAEEAARREAEEAEE